MLFPVSIIYLKLMVKCITPQINVMDLVGRVGSSVEKWAYGVGRYLHKWPITLVIGWDHDWGREATAVEIAVSYALSQKCSLMTSVVSCIATTILHCCQSNLVTCRSCSKIRTVTAFQIKSNQINFIEQQRTWKPLQVAKRIQEW